MLGPEVAVAAEQPARRGACLERRRLFAQRSIKPIEPQRAAGELPSRVEQHLPVRLLLGLQALQILGRFDCGRSCAALEVDQLTSKRIDVPGRKHPSTRCAGRVRATLTSDASASASRPLGPAPAAAARQQRVTAIVPLGLRANAASARRGTRPTPAAHSAEAPRGNGTHASAGSRNQEKRMPYPLPELEHMIACKQDPRQVDPTRFERPVRAHARCRRSLEPELHCELQSLLDNLVR